LIIGIIVGDLAGLALGGSVGDLPFTVIAGLLVTAAAVLNMIMVRGPGVGPDDSRTPLLVIVYSANASLPSRWQD